MKVRYDEGTDALTIPAAGVTAKRGEVIDVPDDVGKKLLDQGPWVKGSAAKTDDKETK